MDLPEDIARACRPLLPAPIERVERVGGGDINQARRLHAGGRAYFLKFHRGRQAADMLAGEARGLRLLSAPGHLRVPEVIGHGPLESGAFLLLENISGGRPERKGWEAFGRGLAALHAEPQPYFGLDHDNYIGSLPQSNRRHDDGATFLMNERFEPQMRLALDSGRLGRRESEQLRGLGRRLPELLPPEPAALVHGDLWSGNYLFDAGGRAVLIDPAVAFAPREMDLAMARLFGGFSPDFYAAYHEAYPMEAGWEDRLEIYQLYFLLVHVNLFGGGYGRSVRRILERWA